MKEICMEGELTPEATYRYWNNVSRTDAVDMHYSNLSDSTKDIFVCGFCVI